MTNRRYPPATLRLEPRAIPAVRAALDEALDQLRPHLARLHHVGYLDQAWLGDEVSEHVRKYYNSRVMDADDGPHAALRAYELELTSVRDTLLLMEQNYHRTEGDNAELWGRA